MLIRSPVLIGLKYVNSVNMIFIYFPTPLLTGMKGKPGSLTQTTVLFPTFQAYIYEIHMKAASF